MTKRLTDEQRDLAETCFDLACHLARSFHRRWPSCPVDDCKETAWIALCDAARNFRPELGHAFTSYVWTSITNRLGNLRRQPKRIAVRLNGAAGYPRGLHVKSIMRQRDTDSVESLYKNVYRHRRLDPLVFAAPEKDLDRPLDLRAAVLLLPDRERQAIELRFFRSMTLKEVGVELGMSCAGASLLVRRALKTLRANLPELEEPADE